MKTQIIIVLPYKMAPLVFFSAYNSVGKELLKYHHRIVWVGRDMKITQFTSPTPWGEVSQELTITNNLFFPLRGVWNR